MSRIALATARPLPEPDPDEALLVSELRQRGHQVAVAAWDDRAVRWEAFDLVVIRSTWDYYARREAFCAWADAVEARTRLRNPAGVVRENTDKRYLEALADRCVPVVPSAFFEQGDQGPLLHRLLCERGWNDLVVKPRISASSFCTRRFRSHDFSEGEAFLVTALRERPMIVQPYYRSVEHHGERALVFIDGELTHAVRKRPRLAEDHERVSGALPIEQDERRVAEQALAPYRRAILYGRVDLVRDAVGCPCVMELELTEPSLFLAQCARALARLADAISAAADR